MKFNNVIITQGDVQDGVQVTFGLFNIKESFGNSLSDQILPDVEYLWSEIAEKEESTKPAFVHNIATVSLSKQENARRASMLKVEKMLKATLTRSQQEKLQAQEANPPA